MKHANLIRDVKGRKKNISFHPFFFFYSGYASPKLDLKFVIFVSLCQGSRHQSHQDYMDRADRARKERLSKGSSTASKSST